MRLLLILTFVLMQLGVMAVDVPAVVEKSFKAKYASATDVEWYDEEDGTYSVYFYMADESKNATFSATGDWIQTQTFIDNEQLPAAINKAMLSKYKGATINGVTLIEMPNVLKQYEVNAEVGTTTYLLTYDEKASLLKSEEDLNSIDDADAAVEDLAEDE